MTKIGKTKTVRCEVCEQDKPTDAFAYVPKRKPSSKCKECELARITAWRKSNPSNVKATNAKYSRTHVVETRKRLKGAGWAVKAVTAAAGRCKKKGLDPPTITVEWVLAQPFVCHYTGIALQLTEEFRALRFPSLDRIDNTKGYTPENTRLTCLAWNQMRNMSPLEDALLLLGELKATTRDNP